MKVKKVLLSIMSIMISANLLSCGSLRDKMVNERLNILNSSNDNEVADENLNKIIDALENKNTDEIRNIFSPNTLEEVKDINDEINYLMNFYKGKVESKDKGTVQTSELSEDGEKKTRLKCRYIINTDEESYLVFFIYQKVDTKDSDNVGVSMLQIIKQSDEDNEFDWGGSKTKCAGIYMPDSDNQQETE